MTTTRNIFLRIFTAALCAAFTLVALYCTNPDFNNPFDSKSGNYAPYTLEVECDSCNVTIDPEKQFYQRGEAVIITIVPNIGYVFDGWTDLSDATVELPQVISDEDTLITFGITISGHTHIKANFTMPQLCNGNEYNVADSVCVSNVLYPRCGDTYYDPAEEQRCEDGIVYGKCGDDEYNMASEVCVDDLVYPKCGETYYNPDEEETCVDGIRFGKCDGVEYNMTDSICVGNIVTLRTTFTLTTRSAPAEGGNITRNPDRPMYASGTRITLTASPNPGYAFVSWDGSLSSSTNRTYNFYISANTEMVANFKRVYTLTANVSPDYAGEIIRSPDKTAYDTDEVVTITAMPIRGYYFVNWTGEGIRNVNSITTTVFMDGRNRTITANFALKPHFNPAITYGRLVDGRDGQTYLTVVMPPDGQIWMAENLNFATETGSWCYDDDETNCDIYGRLYDWNTAMAGASSSSASPSGVRGVCPEGWHLPSHDEWDNIRFDSGILKSSSYWNETHTGTNDLGFSALPGGAWYNGAYSTNPVGNYGYWWSSTENDDESSDYMYINASGIYMFSNYNYVILDDYDKGSGFSVRCVKD